MSFGLLFSDHDESVLIPGKVTGTENNTYQPASIWDDVSYASLGALTKTYVILTSFSFDGEMVNTWFDDWYNRIHLMPSVIDLNNVVTDQTRNIVLWNAYLTTKDLVSTTFPITQGVSIGSPVTTPYTIRPLETLTYVVSVSADGPPVIDVTLSWEISGEDDLTVEITGRRIVVWPFPPNWSSPLVESLDWMTDVMTAYNGDEQRMQLRSKPRRIFEYTSTLKSSDSAIASNLLWGWQNRSFALPLWIDKSTLNASATIGAESIAVNTSLKGYFPGGLVILFNNALDYEVVEIESFTSSAVALAKPLERNWPQGTLVYPVNISQMPVQIPSRRLTDGVTEIQVTFNADPLQTDPYIPSGAATTTYNGYEVVLRKPNWATPVGVDSDFQFSTVDFMVGGSRSLPTWDNPKVARRFQWVLKSKSDIVELRKLFGRLKGRFKAAYLPTWFDDFELYATEVASSSTIRVRNNEFYKMVGSNPALKTLMILPRTGSPIVRLINSVGTDPAGFITLGLDSSIGIDLNSSTLRQLSLVHLCRMTTDRATINYLSDSVATVEANFTLVKA